MYMNSKWIIANDEVCPILQQRKLSKLVIQKLTTLKELSSQSS